MKVHYFIQNEPRLVVPILPKVLIKKIYSIYTYVGLLYGSGFVAKVPSQYCFCTFSIRMILLVLV